MTPVDLSRPLPSTLPERIEQATAAGGTLTFVVGNGRDPVSWAQLHEEAKAMAGSLQKRGIKRGDVVALLGPTSRPLVTGIQAVWLAGATVMVLPLPMRLSSIEEFVAQTRMRVEAAEASMILIDADLAPFYEPTEGDPPIVLFSELDTSDRSTFNPPLIDADDLAVLQFTSGSTSDPKGVMLPHRVILANLDGLAEIAELDVENDVLVSWLPLYHDMGLIGIFTLPMVYGADLVLGSPQDFMGSPARWMEWMSEFGGTATAGPNFSYALATRALRRAENLDLSKWRIALNGAEPVDPDTMDAFVEAAGKHGFNPGACFPAFGMAEVAIAGTFPPPGRGVVMDAVDRTILETERYAAPVADPEADGVRKLALLGKPIPGLEMRICDPETGRELTEREVGELELRGTSVTPGYYRRPEATAATFHDGWLRTGDLAYVVDGELVVCGRIKDVIIVGGRNVFPEDVERAVQDIEGVRAGNVIAFGVPGRGKESLVVVAEAKVTDESDEHRERLRDAVSRRVRQAVGLPPKVILVSPGSLPKTSSGKLQRSLCKQRYTAGELILA
jgi:fatty-acyl-CoA synthase